MGTVSGVPPAKPEVEEVLETKLSNMFSSSLALSLLFFGLASAFELEDSLLEYDESESDPRLFFSNFTSGLVAINTTLLTYGALIVLGGAAIALLMYLLANSGANQRYANAYNQYGGYREALTVTMPTAGCLTGLDPRSTLTCLVWSPRL